MQTATGVMQIASPLFFIVNTVYYADIAGSGCGGLQQLLRFTSFGVVQFASIADCLWLFSVLGLGAKMVCYRCV